MDILTQKNGLGIRREIVLPRETILQCQQHAIISNLYITEIGYYPKSSNHSCFKKNGSPVNVLLYCMSGRGIAKIDGREIRMERHDFLIFPKNMRYMFAGDECNPWSVYAVQFSGRTSAAFIGEIKKRFNDFVGKVNHEHKIVDLFQEMHTNLRKGYSLDNLMYANTQFWNLLSSICYSKNHMESTAGESKIETAIKYMSQNIDQPLSLCNIALQVHLSVSHFSNLFRKETGFAPVVYYNRLKVRRACQLLESSDMRVKELACSLGYKDPFYFSRQFSKLMDQSPLEYRRMKKRKNVGQSTVSC